MPEIISAALKTNASEVGVNIAQSLDYPKLSLGGALKSAFSSAGSQYSSTIVTNPEIGYLQSNPNEKVIGLVPQTIVQKQNYPFGNQLKDNFGQILSLSLSVPIFNNYQGKYGIEKAKINLQSAKLNEESVKIQLRKTIEQAYTDLNAAVKNYAAAKEGYRSEEKAYNDMEKKYNLGLITATDFLIEKNNFEKSSLALVQAKYNYIFSVKILDFYQGKPITLN